MSQAIPANKFLVLDIETTGLNEHKCQILEVGAVVGDYSDTPVTDLPFWRARFAYDYVVGEPYALRMNAHLIADMVDKPVERDGMLCNYMPVEDFPAVLARFIRDHMGVGHKPALGGKNVGTFDLRFLRLTPNWFFVPHHHRLLDPAMLFKLPGETLPPDTPNCIKRAGLEWDSKKLHNAVWDCRLVVELLRIGEKKLG